MLKKLILFVILFFTTYSISGASYIYFYWQWCGHCSKVSSFIDSTKLEKKFNIEKKEIYHNNENRELFLDYAKKLWIDSNKLGVPFLLSENKDKYSIWDKDIINHFKWNIILNDEKKDNNIK